MPVLLLDVDGTLIDSYPGIRDSVWWMCDHLQVPRPSEDLLHTFIGPPMRDNIAKLDLAGTGVSQTEALACYRQHYEQGNWAKVRLFSGWEETLARWQAQGFRLFTATSKGQVLAQRTLGMLGIDHYFSGIVGADPDVGRDTKAKVIGQALQVAGVEDPAHEVLMIGDRRHDTQGAAAFNISTLLVTWGHGTPEEWDEAYACAHNLSEMEGIVDEFFA